MRNPCERMIEKILALITDQLSAKDAVNVGKHVNECSGCKAYHDQLENDDRLLDEFVNYSEDTILRIESNVISALEDIDVEPDYGIWDIIEDKIGISKNVILKYSAAAVAFFVTGLFIIFAINGHDDIAKRDHLTKKTTQRDVQQIDQAESDEIKLQLQQCIELARAGNVDGLIDMLEYGKMPAKLLAAKLLSDMSAYEAIEVLRHLSEHSDDLNNPFQQAIDKIEASEIESENDLNLLDINDVNLMDSNGLSNLIMRGYLYDVHTGQPVSDVSINFYGPKNFKVMPDVNGFYEVKGDIPEGTYNLVLFSESYLSSYTKDARKTVELINGEVLYKDFNLSKGCTIDLEVTDANENPLQEAVVSVYSNFGRNGIQHNSTVSTDSNGFAVLGAFEPNDKPYSILVTHDDYMHEVYPVSMNDVNVVEFVKIKAKKGIKVQGYAYYSGGESAENVKISAQPENFPVELIMNTVDVDANGFFEFNSIKEGRYKIRALNTINSQIVEVDDINLPVRKSLLEVILPIKAPDKLASIEGFVVFDEKIKVSQRSPIIVIAESEKGQKYLADIAPNGNQFSFKQLEPGIYKLIFQGNNILTKVINSVSSGTENLEVKLTLKINPTVTGQVINSKTLKPVKSYTIRFINSSVLEKNALPAKFGWSHVEHTNGFFSIKLKNEKSDVIQIKAKGYKQMQIENFDPYEDNGIILELIPADF